MPHTPILILAGGSSSRMAPDDKLMEPVSGIPLLRAITTRAMEVSRRVSVLVRPDWAERKAVLEGLDVDVFEPEEAFEGIGGSLRAGCERMSHAPRFLLLLGDLPEIRAEDMRAVIAARNEAPDKLVWRGATSDGKPGHPILFSSATYPVLLGLSGDRGANSELVKLTDNGQVHLVDLPESRARLDLDTPEDWSKWRKGQ